LKWKYEQELKTATAKANAAWTEEPTPTFYKLKHAAEHVKALMDWASNEEASSTKLDWKPSDKKPEPTLTTFVSPVA